MKTLNEYLERNNYNIVKSLMDALSIDEESAKNFYKSVSPFDEGKLLDAIKEPVTPEDMEYVKSLYKTANGGMDEASLPADTVGDPYDSDTWIDRSNQWKDGKLSVGQPIQIDSPSYPKIHGKTGVIDSIRPDPIHGELVIYRNDMDGKLYSIKKGSVKPANLSRNGQVEETADAAPADTPKENGPRYKMEYVDGAYNIVDCKTKAVIDKVHSGNEAQNVLHWYNSKKEMPQGVEESNEKAAPISSGYEKRVSPVLESTDGKIQFKLVESTEITKDQIVLESSVSFSPLGGLSAVNGLGMNSLRKMSGIVEQEEEIEEDQDIEELNETMAPEMADVMAFITNMDDQTRSLLMGVLSLNVAKKPAMTAEQMLCVKDAVREFGCALQCWIDDACGALDFLCPLVEALWIKYNEFCV